MVVTQGPAGVLLATAWPAPLHKRAFGSTEVETVLLPVEQHVTDMVDCTGAGDTLAGGTIAALAAGRSIEEALKFGMAAAALTVASPDAISPLVGAPAGLRL